MKKMNISQMENLQGGLFDWETFKAIACATSALVMMNPDSTEDQLNAADSLISFFGCAG